MEEICRQRVHDVMVTVRFASSAVILSALCAAASLVPATADAQGLFDFLFGGFRQQPPRQESYPAAPAPGIGRIAPAPLGQESVTEGGGSAVAKDGQRYGALDTAFLYRKQLVANCTCNGRNAFGLTSFDVKRDPTLRPGDIVSTNEGLLAFTGRSEQGAAFTPVNPARLPPNIKGSQAPPAAATTTEPAVEEETGTIVQRSNGLLSSAPPAKR